jgi:diacylglycerol O-acyltransferase / wax synthase
VSTDDKMSLVSVSGPPPMVGAALILGAEVDPARLVASLVASLGARLCRIPRLRQRLVRLPIWCGSPIWVDDPAFDLTDHVSVVRCPAPGGLEAVLGVASDLLAARLPPDRALWAAVLVTDVAEGQSALILALHHVLADGVGGLAVLAGLVDGAPEQGAPPFPRPEPTRAALVADAASAGLQALRELPTTLIHLMQALIRFGPTLRTRLARSSLNRPTGPRRRFTTVHTDLESVRAVAHAQGATINDVVLSAVTGALHGLLAGRQEELGTFVVSVPVSSRPQVTAHMQVTSQELGNRSAVIPLRLPGTGAPVERLREVASITRAAKRAPPGASNALLGPAFGLLAQLGLYQRFIDHQRLIHTFVTNLKGPDTPLSLSGALIVDIIPLATASGNVTVSFAVLSYAGRLTVTLIADLQTCPDQGRLQMLLEAEFAALTGRPVHQPDRLGLTGPA